MCMLETSFMFFVHLRYFLTIKIQYRVGNLCTNTLFPFLFCLTISGIHPYKILTLHVQTEFILNSEMLLTSHILFCTRFLLL